MTSRAGLFCLLSASMSGLGCGGGDSSAGAVPGDSASLDDGTATGDSSAVDDGVEAGPDAVTDSLADSPTDGSDAGRPCVADPDGTTTMIDGFDVKTVIASGLAEPADVTFGLDGLMYISNSRSVTTTVDPAVAGEILRRKADGTLEVFLADGRMRGPYELAFMPGGKSGGPGILHVGLEDLRDSLTHPNDVILVYDGVTATFGPAVYEPDGLSRSPGGTFGDFVYYASRTSPTTVMPNPERLFRIEGGVAKQITLTEKTGGAVLGAVRVFDWGHGGTLGTDMYIGTAEEALTPASADALYRTDPTFQATKIANVGGLTAIAASPSLTAGFGDFLYVSTGTDVKRIDATGAITPVVSGFQRTTGMTFGPDGALYVVDVQAKSIRRIAACKK